MTITNTYNELGKNSKGMQGLHWAELGFLKLIR